MYTLEERKQNYTEVRNKIFNSEISIEKPNRYRRIKWLREKFDQKKRARKMAIEAIKTADRNMSDPRPYAEFKIGKVIIKGLLDTGASVSILGKGCRELFEELEVPLVPIFTFISTASGQKHRLLGKIRVDVEYNNMSRKIEFYLCPDLEQPAYLGVDFWRNFEIAPEVVGVSEINVEKIIEDFSTQNHKSDPHLLTDVQQNALNKVIKTFPAFEVHGLGCTALEKHSIKLIEGAEPFKDRHYPMSPAVQELVYGEIDKMLALRVIEESESPWSNRTTIVRKPGKNRFCLDARKINKLTVKDAYPLQNIDGILSRIDETYFISSVDLKFAFWQIELEEESKPYTAFTVAGRPLYQFRVMPFGLCNAAQRLCRLMDKVIPQRLKENVFIYLDDLLVISDTFEKHLQLLGEVSRCLRDANLTIGLSKSQFCFKQLKYLGFIIGGGMLKTDSEKVQAIKEIEVPKSIREVRSFLGIGDL